MVLWCEDGHGEEVITPTNNELKTCRMEWIDVELGPTSALTDYNEQETPWEQGLVVSINCCPIFTTEGNRACVKVAISRCSGTLGHHQSETQ